MAVITSTNYWSTVFKELQREVERNGHVKYLMIAKRYDQAVREIEDRLIAWYGKHSIDNKIPLKLAYKKLPPEQLEQFKELIDLYLRNWNEELGYDLEEKPIERIHEVSKEDTTTEYDVVGESINDTNDWIEYLQECRNRDDITHFEALSIPIINEVEKVSHDTANTLLELLVITGWAVHYDITKNLKTQALAQDVLKKELLKSWAVDGVPLYDRFNANKAKLSASVKSALLKGFRNEMSVNEVVAEVSKMMGIGSAAAKRLVLTENTHFNNYSTMLALKKAGYTHYQYVCRMMPTSCEDCVSLHLSVFPLDAYEEGITAPSLHPNCVCYIRGVK